MDEKIKVLAIAPYKGLSKLIMDAAKGYPNMDVEVLDGNLDIALEQIEKIGVSQYDAIISRGGTAASISSRVSIPVINIGITVYDFMRAIRLSRNFSGKSAIVGFPSITELAERVISEFSVLKTDIFTINTGAEIDALYQRLMADGYRSIIGDVFACDCAKEFNLNAILLTSGSESVAAAFAETQRLCGCLQRCQLQVKMLQNALYLCSQKMVIFDSGGLLVYSSLPLSWLSLDEILRIKDTIPMESTQILQIHGDCYQIFKSACTLMDTSFLFFYIYRLDYQPQPLEYLHILNYGADTGYPAMESAVYRSYLQPCLVEADILNQYNLPIFICGADGTSRDALAYLIHRSSKNRYSPFIILDCAVAPEIAWKQIDDFLTEAACCSPLPTLYVKNFNALPNGFPTHFFTSVQRLVRSSMRVLLSCTVSVQTLLQKYPSLEPQLLTLTAHQIHIPTLSETKPQIQELASICINEANLRYGKQIINICSHGIQRLIDYPWPGNLAQLCRVMDALVLSAAGSVILEEEIQRALKTESAAFHMSAPLPENQCTLENASLWFIQKVLAEENNNYSKTAARLGISRSTLWRKLQALNTKPQ